MSNVHSLYFDGVVVQAVNACISGKTVTIKDTRTFPEDELDEYLSTCKDTSFVISCNPLLFHQDILYLPPAAVKHYDKLVRTELYKLHPELTSFTSFYSVVGQATVDAMVHNKIAAFSYEDDPLSDFITRFNRHNKKVLCIYAAPYAVFRLIASTCGDNPDTPRLLIAYLPGEKLFMMGENNELEFIRKMPSSDAALIPVDVQNINMTLDYCFQSLRVKPTEVIMLNQTGTADERAPLTSVPLTFSMPPRLANLPLEILTDYLAPLASALHYHESPRVGSILPADYLSFFNNKKIIETVCMVMFALALLLAGFSITQWMVVSDLKSSITVLKSQLSSSAEELATFRKLDDEVKTLNQRLKFVRKHDPATALAALKLPVVNEYAIKSVSAQYAEDSQSVRLEGEINTTGLSDTQIVYEAIIAEARRIPGYTVTASNLDIKQKTFSIQASYNGDSKKGT